MTLNAHELSPVFSEQDTNKHTQTIRKQCMEIGDQSLLFTVKEV